MTSTLRSLALLVVLLAPSCAVAQWSLVGIARQPGPCDEPLGPSRGELFAWQRRFSGEELFARTEACIDGVVHRSRVDWDERTGAWQATGLWGVPSDHYFVTITAWPDPAVSPLSEHRGILFLDGQRGLDGWLAVNHAQELATPIVLKSPGINDVIWTPVTEWVPRGGACDAGAEIDDPGRASPPILVGWNVYRLLRSDVPPEVSTPDHYLCGPDLDCSTTGDNGFVAHVPNVPGPDGRLHFVDVVPTDPLRADFVYVAQPVRTGAPTGDANADGIPDEDLNADGIPEFVDPSSTGRGLTARVVGVPLRKPILVGPDSISVAPFRLFMSSSGGRVAARWEPLGTPPSSGLFDLHAGFLSDLRDRAAFAARDRLACGLPATESGMPIEDPLGAGRSRYYLLSSALDTGTGWIEDYGVDSFGVPRPATTTLPACR